MNRERKMRVFSEITLTGEVMLTLLLVGMLTVALDIRLVLAEPTTIHVDEDNTAGPWDGTAVARSWGLSSFPGRKRAAYAP